jgi:hypothetical protein
MNIARGTVLLAVVWLASVHVPWAATPPAPGVTVIVRAYDRFGVPPDEMDVARSTVQTIMRAAGVDIEWRTCRAGHGPAARSLDACAEPLGLSDLIIRIVATPAGMREPDVLGFSYIVGGGREPSVMGTVLADRTQAEARRLGLSYGTLLGRAVAHEIGHLTMGTLEHGGDGVMQASWPGRPDAHRLAERWQFTAHEAAIMRRALARRASSAGEVGIVAQRTPALRQQVEIRP